MQSAEKEGSGREKEGERESGTEIHFSKCFVYEQRRERKSLMLECGLIVLSSRLLPLLLLLA